MSVLALIGYIAGIFGLVAVVSSAFVVSRSAVIKQTVEGQTELIDTLKNIREEQKIEIEKLNNKHNESSKAIANMQGQIDVLKNIPLKDIAKDLSSIAGEMAKISEVQSIIMDRFNQQS